MSVRKRGKSWVVDIMIPTGQKDENGKDIRTRYRKTFKMKKEADAEHDKMRTLLREGRFLDVKKEYTTTLGELLQKYNDNYKHQPSFFRNKNSWLQNFREFLGEETRLDKIRYVNLESYRTHLRHKRTKRGTVRKDASINRELSCLRHAFKKAVTWEMIDKSPFEMGESLLLKENNQRLRFLSQDEIKRLLDECPKYLYRIVFCALHTGMRQGEILSLTWSQIRNGFIYLEKTKTNEPRQIPINDELDALFREMRKERGFGQGHVFVYRRGEDKLVGEEPVRKRKGPRPVPEPVQDIHKAFNSALARAGIRDFHFHDLRHSFASHLAMRGASMKDLQELLGHKDPRMTARYAHLSQEHKQKAVNLLKGLTTAADTEESPMSQNVTKP